jgi:hypothetical protein
LSGVERLRLRALVLLLVFGATWSVVSVLSPTASRRVAAEASQSPQAVVQSYVLAGSVALKITPKVVSRNKITFCNDDVATIWVGPTAATSNGLGVPIAAGTCWSSITSYVSPGNVDWWAYSLAGTTGYACDGDAGIDAGDGGILDGGSVICGLTVIEER